MNPFKLGIAGNSDVHCRPLCSHRPSALHPCRRFFTRSALKCNSSYGSARGRKGWTLPRAKLGPMVAPQHTQHIHRYNSQQLHFHLTLFHIYSEFKTITSAHLALRFDHRIMHITRWLSTLETVSLMGCGSLVFRAPLRMLGKFVYPTLPVSFG